MALLRTSKDDAKAAAAEQAKQLSARIKPLAHDTKERMAPVVESARERVGPAYAAAKDKVGPAYEATRDRVGPAYAATKDKVGPAYYATKERVGPTVDVARERLNEEVIPRLAGALAVAAETMAERAGDLHDKAYEVSVGPEKRRKRRRRNIVLILAIAAGTAAGISVLVKKNRSNHWEKFEAQANEWAQASDTGTSTAERSSTDLGGSDLGGPELGGADFGSTTGLGDVGSDDTLPGTGEDLTGASPDEAFADGAEAPGEPTDPDHPAEERTVGKSTRKRGTPKPSS